MTRPLERTGRLATSHPHGAPIWAAWLLGLFALTAGCTGQIGAMASGQAGASNPAGTGNSTGSGVGGGQTGGNQGTAGQGTPGQGGSTGLGGDPYAIPSSPPATVLVATPRVARLSRQQWSNAVRDLLKLTDISDIDSGVTGDALMGFDNEADALFVTEQLRAQLFDASEKLADKVTGDATALGRLVPANAPTDTAGKAKAFITAFGQRAFRRPLTDAEVTTHTGLFNQASTLYPGVDAFKAGASLVIQALLQSPYFLYRTELGTAAAGASKVPLNDWEVSAKLALSITNTIPDDTLLAAASAGQLHTSAGVATQAKRLLDGSTGTAGLSNFNLQVYRLGTYDGITRDATVFPDFKPNAPAAMKQEVLQYLNWMFTQGRGIKDFYTTSTGFVDSLLAPIYGVTGNFSSDPATLTKVDLDPTQRSGLLTQAGFLSSYLGVGNEPDIIHRGVFIATRLLCKTLPPPDPKAAGTMIPNNPNLTNRQRVEMTTGKGTCGEACHNNLFNPLGFAFENYDAIGKYRTMDVGQTVDAASSYAFDGQLQTFSNGVELSQRLAAAKETHACYALNMMSYLHGRELTADEQTMVDYYARLSRAGMVSLHDLELAIVTSDAFLNRLP
jgi:Protein of unknown function (DUF1592)/Protein of unknown function (DUF1588)/Protein of unknown function (DUF1595)/Protein of unknown function (DUF1587)/Protein of unknown function (DUF1585)